jgi:hypothetical protein
MGCLLALFALISPRFALALLYLFSDRLTLAFHSGWEGILGFFLLPYTTLFYALVYRSGPGLDTLGWIIVALGVLLDLSSTGFGSRAQRRRSARRAPD